MPWTSLLHLLLLTCSLTQVDDHGLIGWMRCWQESLMEGLQNVTRAGELNGFPPVIITEEVDHFLQSRIGISILVRHYLDLKKKKDR